MSEAIRRQYERLQHRLTVVEARNLRDGGKVAERIREQMDQLWHEMSPAERERAQHSSYLTRQRSSTR